MALDTQQFGITRHWLSVALEILPSEPNIFASARLRDARKAFLAGKNQLIAIKNWLSNAGVIDTKHGKAEVNDLGRLIAVKDPHAERAWTWWLFHLHLCANSDSYPYSTFFTGSDAETTTWMTEEDILEKLGTNLQEMQIVIEPTTVMTYFQGITKSFRPGWPLYDLRMIERRKVDRGRERLRRCSVRPADIVVAYGILLFQYMYFRDKTTVEARLLLDKGLARSLGIDEQTFRDALGRIHHDPVLSETVQYRGAVNLDSVQFVKMGEPALKALRTQAYASEGVQWP